MVPEQNPLLIQNPFLSAAILILITINRKYRCESLSGGESGVLPHQLTDDHLTQVARKAKGFPTLLDVVREQKMTLTVASLLAPHLTPETADKMIYEYCGLTRREAEDRIAKEKSSVVPTTNSRHAWFTVMQRSNRPWSLPGRAGGKKVSP